jgi:hypothetical protein
VTGDRVLAGRRFRHPAKGAAWLGLVASSPSEIDNPSQTQRSQRGHGQGHRLRNVAERVAAAIAVSISVRQLADPYAVEDDEDDPAGTLGWGQAAQASCVE